MCDRPGGRQGSGGADRSTQSQEVVQQVVIVCSNLSLLVMICLNLPYRLLCRLFPVHSDMHLLTSAGDVTSSPHVSLARTVLG